MSDKILKPIFERDPGEKEFHQAAQEMIETVMPVLVRHPEYRRLGNHSIYLTADSYHWEFAAT